MDVANHFGLAHLPFRATIAPRDAWVGGPFSAAISEILTRLRAGEALVALTGPMGTGKSLALRTAAERLGKAGEDVRHFGRTDQLPDELPTRGILIVDEADASDPDRLRQVAEAAGGNFQLVLAGEGSFLAGLRDAPRVAPIWLLPLDADDAAAFVRDRLVRSGKPALFDEAAIHRVSELGGGVPRQIGAIAGAALLEAALDGAAAVSVEHVERAAATRASYWPRKPVPGAAEVEPAEVAAPAITAPLPPERSAAPPPVHRTTAPGGRRLARVAAIVGLVALPLWAVLQQPWTGVRDSGGPTSSVERTRPAIPTAVPIAPIVAEPAPAIVAESIPEPPLPPPDMAAAASPPPVLSAPTPAAGATGRELAARPSPEAPREPAPVAARRPAAETARSAEASRAAAQPAAAQDAAADPDARVETAARSPERELASPAAPIELPSPRAEPAAAAQCSCPPGMSAARCQEWKAWRACRPKD